MSNKAEHILCAEMLSLLAEDVQDEIDYHKDVICDSDTLAYLTDSHRSLLLARNRLERIYADGFRTPD